MDSRIVLRIVKEGKEKKLECALVALDVQKDIEHDAEADLKARELQFILHGGKYPE